MNERPRLLITMGDVAGIGPEIIAKAWPQLNDFCRLVVVGDPDWMRRALKLVNSTSPSATVREIHDPKDQQSDSLTIPCLSASAQDLRQVEPGRVSAAAGKAAYDFLCKAIDLTVAGSADGIVTAPLHKEGLRAAGLRYPGHTEILAERTGTTHFAMMLYCNGLGVSHVTLHMALREIFQHLTRGAILEKIRLLDQVLAQLLPRTSAGGATNQQNPRPRIGVAGLNPHAGDGGLFGDEETGIIRPAVEAAIENGLKVSGPWPSDTLFVRAKDGEFDGLVVMYHDQGHIALKLLGGRRAVNISAGLPIVRTSVAHGTAYDIAGKGVADESSLIEAARVATKLVMTEK
jgi:4-hydroxythreonine-4-phosphate dehydrogenase